MGLGPPVCVKCETVLFFDKEVIEKKLPSPCWYCKVCGPDMPDKHLWTYSKEKIREIELRSYGPYIAYSQTREEERDLLEKCLGLSCINRVDMLPLQLQTIYYNLLSEKQKVSIGHHIAFGWCVIRYFEQEHPCANTPYISFSESVLVMKSLKKMNLSDCPTCKMDSYKTPGGCACKTCGMLGMQPWGG